MRAHGRSTVRTAKFPVWENFSSFHIKVQKCKNYVYFYVLAAKGIRSHGHKAQARAESVNISTSLRQA
jgi:hypothetical protein